MTATVNSANASGPARAGLDAEDVHDDELFGAGPAPRRRGRRIITLATVVVLVAALAGAALSSTRASGARYRVATVTNADATAVLDGVATIEPVSQAAVAFPVAGTVTKVAVKAGQTVRAGETLAALDTTSLYETVHTDEASLAQAKLTLADALDGTSSTNATSGTGASNSSATASGTATLTAATTATVSTSGATTDSTGSQYAAGRGTAPTTSGSGDSNTSAIAAGQRAVVAAQAKVDRALANADSAIKAAETVCGTSTTHTATPTTTATTTGSAAPAPPSTTAASTTSTTTSTGTNRAGSCTAALQTSLAAQQSVSAAQRSLDAAVQRLTTLLDAEASSTASNTNGTGNGTGLSTGTGTQTGAQTGASTGAQSNGGSSTAKTASAADLEADQTRVDAASAKLAVAVEALSQARVTTPIAGTVIAVNIPAGDAVSANSSTATIVVAGAKGYEVTTSVPVTQIARVTVGQQASVLPDGAASTINGRVSEISALPATSTTGTIGYTVVISLDHAPSTLADGTTGSVSITTDAAKAALVVPSSAVHTSGKRHTVTVALASSRTKTVTVTLGVQGAITTQIRQGVAAGQQVVIADLHKALPSSATSTQSSSRTNRNAPSDLGGGVTGGPPGGFTPPSR